MKKNLLIYLFFLVTGSNLMSATNQWVNDKIPWTPKNSITQLRSAQLLNETCFDSIALPYTSLGTNFNILTTAYVDSVPQFGTMAVMGWKFYLPEKSPLTFGLSSDSITEYAFTISQHADLTDPVYYNIGAGFSDSLEAGVYYIALVDNFQHGPFDISIKTGFPPILTTYKDISIPLDSVNIDFDGLDFKIVNVVGFGTFPGVGYKFTLPNDTVLCTHFESSSIGSFTYAITNHKDGLLSSDFANPEKPDTLAAGTYYLTIVTNYQYGNYNLFMQKGLYNVITYTPVSFPYTVVNELFDNTTVDIVSLGEGLEGDRMLGLKFTLDVDTAIVVKFNSEDITNYSLIFSNTPNLSIYLSVKDSLKTTTIGAGDYYILLYTYSKYGNYDLSITPKSNIPTSDKLEKNEFRIYTQDNTIVAAGIEPSSSILVYDLQGNVLHNRLSSNNTETFQISISGIYIVSINGLCKKILVK